MLPLLALVIAIVLGASAVAGAAAGILPPLGFVLPSRGTPQPLVAADIS